MRGAAARLFAGKLDRPVRWLVYVGQKVENGGFTRSVRTDKADYLVLAHLQAEIVKRGKAAERDAKMIYVENAVIHCAPPCFGGGTAFAAGG